MPDLATIAAAINSIKTATDIAKGFREAGLSLEKAEHKFRLAELMTALAEARIATASVQEEVLSKDRQIRELQEKLDLRARMTYSAPFYWQEQDGKRDGPFCQQCYDSQHRAIRLQDYGNNSWFCTTCRNSYDVMGSRPRQSRADTDYDLFSP